MLEVHQDDLREISTLSLDFSHACSSTLCDIKSLVKLILSLSSCAKCLLGQFLNTYLNWKKSLVLKDVTHAFYHLVGSLLLS